MKEKKWEDAQNLILNLIQANKDLKREVIALKKEITILKGGLTARGKNDRT
jgi:hypothetical protein